MSSRRGAPVDDVRFSSLASLDASVTEDGGLTDRDLRHDVVLALVSSDLWNEEVEEAGEDEKTDDEYHDNVHDAKGIDEGGVLEVACLRVKKLGVRKCEDKTDSRGGNVLESDRPEPVNSPVFASNDDTV